MSKQVKTLSIYGFMKRFSDDGKARKFVENIIWKENPACPYCRGKVTTPRPKRHGHHCSRCRRDFTVRKRTIFDNSKAPYTWLMAMYLVVTARKSISSLQL